MIIKFQLVIKIRLNVFVYNYSYVVTQYRANINAIFLVMMKYFVQFLTPLMQWTL